MVVEYVGVFTAGALAGGLVWDRVKTARAKRAVLQAQARKKATAVRAAEKRKKRSLAKLEKANEVAARAVADKTTESSLYGRKSNGEASWGT